MGFWEQVKFSLLFCAALYWAFTRQKNYGAAGTSKIKKFTYVFTFIAWKAAKTTDPSSKFKNSRALILDSELSIFVTIFEFYFVTQSLY